MVFIRSLQALFAGAVIFSVSIQPSANMGPLKDFRGGGVVAPDHAHQSIQLESEEVIIRLNHRTYTVQAIFNFVNTGATTTEWIGFPKWTASRSESFPNFLKFEGTVNGTSIKFCDESEISESKSVGNNSSSVEDQMEEAIKLAQRPLKVEHRWLAGHVTFPGHSKTTIHAKYEANYHKRGWLASYIYGTGSLWKDNIRKAVFIVDSSEVGGNEKISTKLFMGKIGPGQSSLDIDPPPRPIANCVLKYELRNFKPQPEAFLSVKFPRPEFVLLRPAVIPPPPPRPLRRNKNENGQK